MKKLRLILLFTLFLSFSCLGFSACNEREMVSVDGYGVYVHENGKDCSIVQLPSEVLNQTVWEIPEKLGEYTVVQVGDTITRGFMSSPEEAIDSFGHIRKMIVPASVEMIRAEKIEDVLIFQTELSPSHIELENIDHWGYSPTTAHWWQSPQQEAGYRYLTEENYDGDLIYIMEGEVGEETPTLLAALGNGALTLPQTFKGQTVTKLADRAFYKSLYTSVTIGESVVDFGEQLFADSSIEQISLPMSCTEIPDEAFYGSSLKSVEIPPSVTRIGEYAFSSTDLTEITLPSSVVDVGRYAFAGTPLTFADFSQTQLTTIAPAMFDHCPLTDGMQLPNTITTIQSNAFAYTGLTSFVFPSSLNEIWGEAFRDVQLESIHLPDQIKRIEIGAFLNNLALTELRLPDSCIYFYSEAIRGCTNLKSLHLGNVKSFSSLPTELSLEKITVSESNEELYVKDGILYCRNPNGTSTLIKCPQAVACESLVLENCSLAYGAFYMHPTLKEITIIYSGSTYEIPGGAFYECSALEKVVLPDVEGIIINSHAFYQCVNLSEINTGKVTKFFAHSFTGCSSLTEADFTSATILGGAAFKDCDLRKVHTYQLKSVGVNAFENNVNLEKVILENCQTISFDAFRGCKRLKSCSYGKATVESGAFVWTPLVMHGCQAFLKNREGIVWR